MQCTVKSREMRAQVALEVSSSPWIWSALACTKRESLFAHISHLVKVTPRPSLYSSLILAPTPEKLFARDLWPSTTSPPPFFYHAWFALASVSHASVPKEQPRVLCYLGASAPALPRAGCRVALVSSDYGQSLISVTVHCSRYCP